MAIQYVIHFTDPATAPFVVNPYSSNGPVSPISSAPAVARTSLLFYGKGSANYGERFEENFINLLESFSGPVEPVKPVSGQIWFQRNTVIRTSAAWYSWDDTAQTWSAIAVNAISAVTPNSLGTPTAIGGSTYKVGTTGLLFFGVTTVGHPLYDQWVQYNYTNISTTHPSITNPNTASLRPEKTTKIFNGISWVRIADPLASDIEPSNPSEGTMWFNTDTNELNVYNGTSFVQLVSSSALSQYVLKAGDSMSGTLNMTNHSITNVTTPVANGDAVNKLYVDTQISTAIGGVALELDDLGDVDITTPTVTQTLRYSGTSWVNSNLITTDILGVTATSTEINNTVGTTSAIQTQLNNRVIRSGDTMTGFLTLNADPGSNLHAATKQYVDGRDVVSGSVAFDTLTLNRGNSSTITITGLATTAFVPPYEPADDELMRELQLPPSNVVEAVHALDKVVKRRTTPTRAVITGTTSTTYNVPVYEVGSYKLFVFVDGIKWQASEQGHQRVIFDLSPFGSPSTPEQLDCGLDPGLNAGSPNVYQTNITIDGGSPQTITISGSSATSYCAIVDAINTQLSGGVAVLEDDSIVVYSNSHGTGSTVSIVDGTLPLFGSMNYFNSILAAVPGVTRGYNEVGSHGVLSNQIVFQGSAGVVDSTTMELIVLGDAGFPYL